MKKLNEKKIFPTNIDHFMCTSTHSHVNREKILINECTLHNMLSWSFYRNLPWRPLPYNSIVTAP